MAHTTTSDGEGIQQRKGGGENERKIKEEGKVDGRKSEEEAREGKQWRRERKCDKEFY